MYPTRFAALLALLLLAPAHAGALPTEAGSVLISEVHPCPEGEPADEYVELHLPEDAPGCVGMEGWTLTDNDGSPELIIGRVTLEPGTHLVIWNHAPPENASGIGCGKATPTWNDDGDDVVLLDAIGRTVSRLAYGSGQAVDPPSDGAPGAAAERPPRGTSVSLDPDTGLYVLAPPSPGRARPAAAGGEAGEGEGPSGHSVGPGHGREEGGGGGDDGAPFAPAAPDAPDPSTGAGLLIDAVHPGGGIDWECVVVRNAGANETALLGWRLTDGEGVLTVATRLTVAPGAAVHVAVNASAHQVLWGRGPDALATRSGGFALSDAGDSLSLMGPGGSIVDQVWYGEASGAGGAPDGWHGRPVATPTRMPWGRLLCRRAGPDTDSAADWEGPVEASCGWMAPSTPSRDAQASVLAFTTPGCGTQAALRLVSGARAELDVALYMLTSRELASALAARSREGVNVRLLLEGSPVGRTDPERQACQGLLAALERSGVEVWETLRTSRGQRLAPYGYHHMKYAVADRALSMVTTENWVASSFPPTDQAGVTGTRGWGVLVRSAAIASRLVDTMEHDIARCSIPWNGDGVRPDDLPQDPGAGAGRPLVEVAAVTLLVGPEAWRDGLGPLLGPLGSATSTIDVELASLEVTWGNATSPLVQELLGAAMSGVAVRVLIDPGPGSEGWHAREELRRLAAEAGADSLRVRLARDLRDASRVHAKGAVVDGTTALLGSLNWGRSSVARNREVLVVVEGGAVLEPLRASFERDWADSGSDEGAALPVWMQELLLGTATAAEAGQAFEGPVGGEDQGALPSDLAGGERWTDALLRAVIVMAIGLLAWFLERRFAVWARLEGGARRVVERVAGPGLRALSRLGVGGGVREDLGGDPDEGGGEEEEPQVRIVRLGGPPGFPPP